MATRDLLIEIGTEELPPKALSRLSSAFADQIAKQLQGLNLGFGDVERFATPRRLAVLVRDLEAAQQDNEKTRLGPAIKAAFDQDGQPTKAAAGFARSCGVDVADLARSDKDGTEKLAYTVLEKGQATTALIPDLLEPALSQLPIPKRMRWGSSRNEFVRPVHWLVVLFGSEAVPASVLGINSSPATRGHRFHHNSDIPLGNAGAYEAVLRHQGKVIASFDKRREMIREQVLQEGDRLNAIAVIDPDLLEEVTNLVEFPVALTGSFEKAFLTVPQEALILAMKSHQKYFYLADSNGKLLPKFITISNIESTDPEQVIKGNERVIRPRLADAQFFYVTDKESPLESRQAALGKLIFQDKLGTVLDKCQRVGELATVIANQVGADPEHCQRAAQLAKCDLLTNMVGEFADLQGLMGSYYAEHDGEPRDVSKAIYEQYQPRFAGDVVPGTLTGSVLAIADKLDSMVGLFGVGQPPTGSKDPFALRRAAIGLLRIIVEKQLSLDLSELIDASLKTYPAHLLQAETRTQVLTSYLNGFAPGTWKKE
jgi:glycyl-tRNA synthetase beta chain